VATWQTNLAYLVAAVLFIFGLKGLGHPRTAVRGNLTGALGMLIAIVATLFSARIGAFADNQTGWILILLAMGVGTIIGATFAIKVQMTGMPQMVALFNGYGGGASLLVAGAELAASNTETGGLISEFRGGGGQNGILIQFLIATMLAGLIGAVTFWGSLVALGKLQGYKWIPDGKLFRGHSFVTAPSRTASPLLRPTWT